MYGSLEVSGVVACAELEEEGDARAKEKEKAKAEELAVLGVVSDSGVRMRRGEREGEATKPKSVKKSLPKKKKPQQKIKPIRILEKGTEKASLKEKARARKVREKEKMATAMLIVPRPRSP